MQDTSLVGKDQTRRVGLQQFHASIAQSVEQVENVEVVDKGVGKLDEDMREALLPAHMLPPFQAGRIRGCGLGDSFMMVVLRVKGHLPGDHVLGEFAKGPFFGVGTGAQQQQRLVHAH